MMVILIINKYRSVQAGIQNHTAKLSSEKSLSLSISNKISIFQQPLLNVSSELRFRLCYTCRSFDNDDDDDAIGGNDDDGDDDNDAVDGSDGDDDHNNNRMIKCLLFQ